jgi:chromosome segregation ATPase
VRPISGWGISKEDIHKRFDINPLEEELTQLNTALSQAREDMHRQNADISRLRLLTRQIETDGEILFRSNAMSRVLTLTKKHPLPDPAC